MISKNVLSLFALMLSSVFCMAQQQNTVDLALRHIEEKASEWQLNQDDIKDPLVSDMYTSRHNGVTHLYLMQTHNGIPINNAVLTLAIKGNKVYSADSRFIPEVSDKVNTSTASFSAEEAIFSAVKEMGIVTSLTSLDLKSRKSDTDLVFTKPHFSNSDVTAKLVYQLDEDQKLILVWDFSLDMTTNADYWSVRVNAQDGKILNKHNYTVYCNHHQHNYSNDNRDHRCAAHSITEHQKTFKPANAAIALLDDAAYNVFALPVEAPIYGPQTLVANPAILTASPNGWHDTDGIDGPEYTITRGNNVWAYGDINDDDVSDGNEPDGGPDLVFDFEFDFMAEPEEMNALAQVQLFYMTNMMHDISYQVGFTEEAGNFQVNNFGLGGAGNDEVLAQGQDGAAILDAAHTNNANFATPPDGQNGRMQMYLWQNSGVFKVNEPEQLAGIYSEIGTGDFGANIALDNVDITAEVIIVDDGVSGSGTVTDGCTEIMNDITGKVALIDRGVCEFGLKTLNAEMAGAVAVIICNFEDSPIGMAGGAVGGQVTIPVISMKSTDCDLFKASIAAEIPVIVEFKNQSNGPDYLDGDFDNGVIAHEFGHGISTRLTGGPNVGCLGGNEQMGEGWSDFFGLITTVEDGDQGTDKRGIGNYADGLSTNGNGIRNYPYSTDMSINPTTYDMIKGINVPHGVGEVWCQMIWDLYWAFVDVYGYDADYNNTSSGNYRAVLLVMDGMKLQPCTPGFVDGRDAILEADMLNFDGENQCLIWEVFARRGLGFFADQGSSQSENDGTENFDPRPTCIEKLKIEKVMTDFVQAGDQVDVTMTVTNHFPETAISVIVNDEVPAGMQFVAGSSNVAATTSAGMVTFELGDMEYDTSMEITYSLVTDNVPSDRLLYKDMEDGDDGFFMREGLDASINFWNIVSNPTNSGSRAWYIAGEETESDQTLRSAPFTVSGDRPTLRFYHRWNTQDAVDGGFVEISVNGGDYSLVRDEFIRNGYNSPIGYGTLAIPFLDGFTGLQEDYLASYIDLGSYVGQEVVIRFRYAADEADVAGGEFPGWAMDDFELMDLLSYTSAACVTATNVPDESSDCSDALEVIIDTDGTSAVVGVESDYFNLEIFPNPASDVVNINISSKIAEQASAGMFTLDGKLIMTENITLATYNQQIKFNTEDLATGIYLVKIETAAGAITEKVIIQ